MAKQNTLFIADLHLDPSDVQLLQLFHQFWRDYGRHAEKVYILGDLFESWYGDDDDSEFANTVANELSQATASGTEVFLMSGNRDFLMGKRFAHKTGCRYLPDLSLVDVYGRPVLLTHGDSLCTEDKLHQVYRKTLQPVMKFLAPYSPISLRRHVGNGLRKKSKQRTKRTAMDIMDVQPAAVEKVLQKYGADTLIHGHTHRGAIHELSVNGLPAKRIVLHTWHQQGNFLLYTPSGNTEFKPFSAK